jgi:hypothetical protein
MAPTCGVNGLFSGGRIRSTALSRGLLGYRK